ncbi:unnamed protein product [Rhizophagus irregularis]|nr:unnamed protein product [Rhizophagus irregularis]
MENNNNTFIKDDDDDKDSISTDGGSDKELGMLWETPETINICQEYWDRFGKETVVLKSLNNSKDISSSFLREIQNNVKMLELAYYTSRLLNFNNLPEPENVTQDFSEQLEYTIPDDVEYEEDDDDTDEEN